MVLYNSSLTLFKRKKSHGTKDLPMWIFTVKILNYKVIAINKCQIITLLNYLCHIHKMGDNTWYH